MQNLACVNIKNQQKALLLQRDSATCYFRKIHAMFHEVWELERFQTAKVTFKSFKGAI